MPDFERDILSSPTSTYEEGLAFFRGQGMLNSALRRVAADLENAGIDYVVVGAIALNQHGYKRFTEDIDILVTAAGLEAFREQLVGRGYRPAFEGAKRQFRTSDTNVRVEFLTAGQFPGDGKPKAVRFPEPNEYAEEIDGVRTLNLPKLIELKLASGITAPGRLKDLADVLELIKTLDLPIHFADQLDPSVQDKFKELWAAAKADVAQEERTS